MSPILLITIYAALSGFAAYLTDLCLRRWRRTSDRARRIRAYWLAPYILLSLLPVAGAFLPDSPVKFALQAAGNVWLGFYLYYHWGIAMLLLVAWIARRVRRGHIKRDVYGGILCLSVALSVAVVGYGLIHARNTVVRRYELTVDKPGEDMKLILLGDLHLSVNADLGVTERMVALCNAEEPDAVLIAGDVFTSSYGGLAHADRYAEALRGLRAKYGVYAVYGNHDVEETLFGGFPISPVSEAFRPREMAQFFEDCGFITLEDQVVELGGGVQLAGRVDGDKAGDGTANRMPPDALLAGADTSRPILALQHEPKQFKALAEAGADVALCGHTHAGQIFPGNLVVPFFNENAWGYANVHGLDTFVTAGVGCYGPPMRVGTDSEVTVIRLRFGEAAS
ncbi:MAG: metallophosphoesterase family protein [Clostridia bacterium]|nr:metallophosphoesterase family protein [Clostridia bacterium]